MEVEEGEYYSSWEVLNGRNLGSNSMGRKMGKKRRFSEEQVKSLESIFENETKLEPKKKAEVATQLGLQPRQVAIWFQNKRARFKSKQLEREYNILSANYNALASQFDNLKKETHSLLTQLEKLKGEDEGGKEEDYNWKEGNELEKVKKSESDQNRKREEWEERRGEGVSENGGSCILSEEGSSENDTHYLGVEMEGETGSEMDYGMAMMPPLVGAYASFSSAEAWDDDLHCQWWEFWSSS